MKPEPWYQPSPKQKPLIKLDMKAWILKLLFSKVGQLIAAAVSALVGFITTFAAQKLGFYIDAEMQTRLIGGISAAIYALINFGLHKYAGDNIQALQQALGITDDRWIGPETVAAADKAAYYARRPEVMPIGK